MSGLKKSYRDLYEEFKWSKVLAGCDWNPAERFNMAHECCDRHAGEPGRAAVFWLGKDGREETFTFAGLKELSDRFANVLLDLGVQEGDRVAGLLPRVPELLITVLAAVKIGAVYIPLFTAFGPNALKYRLHHSETSVLVTNTEHRGKVGTVTGELPSLKKIVTVTGSGEKGAPKGDVNFWTEMAMAAQSFRVREKKHGDPVIIQYTSGSTGPPKGALWSNRVITGSYPYMKYAIGLQPEDMFWGMADPGWAYGLIICLFAPMFSGNCVVFNEAPFSPENCYSVMEKYQVTNLATAPTVYRALMAAGSECRQRFNVNLRVANSAGEPLNPEAISWFKSNFGVTVCDHYGLTEMLMIVNNFNACDMPLKPGSMGLPTPGFEVALLDQAGKRVPRGEVGQIACNTGGESTIFLGYLNDDQRTRQRFVGSWFLTGDMAMQDEDGYFWFQGRDDDIIKTSGYRVGPFEVESTLLEHPAVAEAAAVGVPDPLKGKAIKCCVVLCAGASPSAELAEELKLFVKNKLAKHQQPKEVEFIAELPKTPSGKVQRFLLRNRDDS